MYNKRNVIATHSFTSISKVIDNEVSIQSNEITNQKMNDAFPYIHVSSDEQVKTGS